MKYIIFIILLLVGCGYNTQPITSTVISHKVEYLESNKFVPTDGRSGRYHIHKLTLDSSEYILVFTYYGTAITKHK